MKRLILMAFLMGAALVVSLAGCGSGNRESSSSASLQASQACIACHNSNLSPVTGNSITTEWLASAHNTRNGASCPDCHTPVNGHPTSGVFPNIPGTDTVCIGCHTSTTMKTFVAHFGTISTASYLGNPDALVSDANPVARAANAFGCRGCHNPHDMTSLINVNKQWAQSKHAGRVDPAFNEDPFVKTQNCSRCHSATGFRYYMTTGKQTPVTAAILGRYSSAKEVVGCNACHTTYNWKRISNDPSVAFATYSTPFARFPNISKNFPAASVIGDTQLCVPCHGGRAARSGATFLLASTAHVIRSNNPTDPHYFPSASVMYMKIGFINFTSQSAVLPAVAAVTTGPTPTGAIAASTYGRTLIASEDLGTGSTTGGVTSTHRKLGTTAINGDSHNPSFFVPGNLDSGGPCVTCHMTGGHSFKINADSYNKVCINCHTSERGLPLNADNFLTAFVDENREQMNSALGLGVKVLEARYNITIRRDSAGNAIDFEEPQESTWRKFSAPTQAADFTKDAAGNTLPLETQVKLRGALFNLAIGYKENASFVHARSYMRRLIYDAIDFLDDGAMNMSVGATALSALGQTVLDPAGNIAFGKGTKAFVTNTDGPLFTGTTPAMTYIIGFDRTTGSWTPALRERP